MPYYLSPLWTTKLNGLSEDQIWDHLEVCLKAFDWTYNFSDDGGVYRAGVEQNNHLDAVMKYCRELDEDRANTLYYKHSFWHNEDGSRKEFA